MILSENERSLEQEEGSTYLAEINDTEVTLKKKKMDAVNSNRSHISAGSARNSVQLVSCCTPSQDPVTLHVSHLPPHLQEKEIQMCRAERARDIQPMSPGCGTQTPQGLPGCLHACLG